MAGRLEGKVAVITGAASGIGAAAARRFYAEGAKLVLGDIQEEVGETLASELGSGCEFVRCDVTREEEVAGLVDAAMQHFGQLDIMYNNAGVVGAVGPIATTPADEWHRTLDIHINGCFYGCKHAAVVMKDQQRGSIINMASTAGVMGGLGPHAYTAAKHAVVGITRSVAAELARAGVRVNCIAPGSMATPMVAATFGDHTDLNAAQSELARTSPLKGRAGAAEDVANAALWLASDESGYTSGLILTTDAGLTIGTGNRSPFAEYEPFMGEAGKRGME